MKLPYPTKHSHQPRNPTHIMNSWKTTLIGVALAVLSFLSIYQTNGGDLSHWQQWLIPALVAALGMVSKDYNVSGSAPLQVSSAGAIDLIKRVSLLLALLSLLGLMFFSIACTTQQQDAAKQELKAVSIQIAAAATKAGAEVALKAAEDKLDKLKAEPVPSSPIAAALRASAIEEAETLVKTARGKVNAFRFSSLK